MLGLSSLLKWCGSVPRCCCMRGRSPEEHVSPGNAVDPTEWTTGMGRAPGTQHHEPPHQFQAWQLRPRRGLSGPRDPARGHARWIRRPEPGEPTQRRPLHSPLLSAWTLLCHVATRVRSVRSYLKLCTINFFLSAAIL